MIKSLNICEEKSEFYACLQKCLLKDKKELQFKFHPGMNIVVGDNGAGKSTVLKYLAALTGTIKAGRFSNFKKMGEFKCSPQEYYKLNSSIESDTPVENVRYFDTLAEPGLMGGSFDYGVPMEISLQTLWGKKQNHGHITMSRLTSLLRDVPHNETNYTLLFDEPDDGMAPDRAYSFWKNLRNNYKCQVIASSQSLCCLGLKNVNYISLTDDWIKNSLGVLELLQLRCSGEHEALK